MTTSPQWMPFNVGDYLRDTHHLSVVEHGAYLLLIMHYWQDGGLPADERMVARLAHLTAEQWIESRDVLAALFNEGWKHKRIEAELAKAADIIEKRRSAGEQRHSKSSARAEQAESTSSYAGVPPLPSPLVIEPPASVLEPDGARDLFSELVEAFPQNPSSSETKARAAFARLKPIERVAAVMAAERYSRWYAQDCEERGRSIDAGLRYVPHLGKWLDSGDWLKAGELPVKGEVDPDLTVVHRGTPEFAALERLRGKPIQIYSDSGALTVSKAELAKAQAPESVH